MIRVSVLYAHEAGKKFDHDYYVNKHMKLVRERLMASVWFAPRWTRARRAERPVRRRRSSPSGTNTSGRSTSSRRAWASTARRSWRTWPTIRPSSPRFRSARSSASGYHDDLRRRGRGRRQRRDVRGAIGARDGGARPRCWRRRPRRGAAATASSRPAASASDSSRFDELRTLIGDLSDQEAAQMEVDPYTEDNFYDDLMRVTEDCADPDMALFLVRESLAHRALDEGPRHPLDSDVRTPGLQGGRKVPLLGRPRPGGGGRRTRADRHGVRLGGQGRHRRPLRGEGDASSHRRSRPGHRPDGADRRGHRDDQRRGRGAGGRRLRGESRDAHALPRRQLGAGARAGHALQHRRRHPHGARHRRLALGALEWVSLRAVGSQRALARRPQGGRQLPEALVPASA